MKRTMLIIAILVCAASCMAQSVQGNDCYILESILQDDSVRTFLNLDADQKLVDINDAGRAFACESLVVKGKTYKLIADAADNTRLSVQMNFYKNKMTVTLRDTQTTAYAIIYLTRKKGMFEIVNSLFDYTLK